MNLLFYRNIRLYRKLPCLAKTPDVRDELLGAGVSDVTVAPVGLDISRLKPDYAGASAAELKTGYGFVQSFSSLITVIVPISYIL